MTSSIPTTEQINAMTDTEWKVYLNKLRRMAQRQGLTVAKSRTRDPRSIDFNTFSLIDDRNTIVAGPGMSIDELHAALIA